MPSQVISSYIIRGGFYSYGFFMRGEASADSPTTVLSNGKRHYDIFQNSHNVLLGFVRKRSIDSKFKTDKYGTVSTSSDTELFFDVIINFANKFPQIDRLFYLNSTYPNKVTEQSIVPFAEQNIFRKQFFRLPVGIRGGWRTQSLMLKGVYAGVEMGIYPGSYSDIISLGPLIGKLTIGYRFLNKLK